MKIPQIRIRNPGKIIGLLDILVTIAGIACIFAGIYQIYPPAAWIVLGLILALPRVSRKEAKK
jgi:Na+-translocating ferredoxin:NAD+ oxidoreductase RnfE subunit